MQRGIIYYIYLAVCCLHTSSEPLRFRDEDKQQKLRIRRGNEKDGLALSKEIFRNITKQLKENIKLDNSNERSDHINNVEESKYYGHYQAYHHHEHHWGPYFEGNMTEGSEGPMQITAHVGAEALLNCRVGMLKDKTVMWLRRTTDSAQLLTVGPSPYAGDNRIAVKFQYPNNWRLSLNPVRWTDSGLYMCQVSTHPPRVLLANLTILAPILTVNGDQTHEVKDRFYKAGSSIKLSCVISEEFKNILPVMLPTTSPSTTISSTVRTTQRITTKMSKLNRIELAPNKSWSIETTPMTSTVSIQRTTKKLLITTTTESTTLMTNPPILDNIYGLLWKKQGNILIKNVIWSNESAFINVPLATQNDSGTYTCHLQSHYQVSVNVHVLIGENQAAVHHDTWNKGSLYWPLNFIVIINVSLLYLC